MARKIDGERRVGESPCPSWLIQSSGAPASVTTAGSLGINGAGRVRPAAGIGMAVDACRCCPIRQGGVCGDLPDPDITLMPAPVQVIATGHDLFSQGEPCRHVFMILEGWVCLYELLEDGRRQILHFALPGDMVGFRPDSRTLPFGAQALNQVRLCAIPRLRLIEAARTNPDLAFRIVGMLYDDGAEAYERLTSIGRKTALERVATLLLELFFRLRRRIPLAHGETVQIPLTQTHIADAVGLTAVHVNRMLGLLRQKGIIDYGNGVFRILAPARLLQIAGADAQGMAGQADQPVKRNLQFSAPCSQVEQLRH